MPEQQLLIDYRGPLSFGVINRLLGNLKEQLDTLEEKISTYKRVLVIMIEVLENINKYLESNKEDLDMQDKFPIDFKLTKMEQTYFISAGNLINSKSQKLIQKKIDLVNDLDGEGLKKLYRKTISNGQFTKEGGAGLGFIEIAKTSQHKIGYTFEQVNDSFTYFTINLEITS
jgi:hypothetical protein